MSDLSGFLERIGGFGLAVAAATWFAQKLIENGLATKLEAFKGDLGRETERLRHDLQREMLKAQLSTGALHLVYPRLFDKLRRAHGAIAGLMGTRFTGTFEGYDRADIESTLSELRIPGEMRRRVLESFDRDRDEGVRRLKALGRRREVADARAVYVKAQNYFVLKSLFASKEVKDQVKVALDHLWKAWVEVDVGGMPGNPSGVNYEKHDLSVAAATQALNLLETTMRKELEPARKSVTRGPEDDPEGR